MATRASRSLLRRMIAATDVTKRYGAHDALRGVSFSAARGERLAIIGPNGAGKTTLLSILGGLVQPTSGSVTSEGDAVGWVPQQTAVYRKLSVAENLRLFARLERVADPAAAVERALADTGLAERAGDELGTLSGGNQQRVNIAIGLLADPPVLLLDEPSSALDPRHRQRVWAFLDRKADAGTTIVFTTHDLAEAARHADRVLVLADGERLFEGTPAELETAVGGDAKDFEAAFVAFLTERGH
jgi:ABC-2 type transport system ATP-binding protein